VSKIVEGKKIKIKIAKCLLANKNNGAINTNETCPLEKAKVARLKTAKNKLNKMRTRGNACPRNRKAQTSP